MTERKTMEDVIRLNRKRGRHWFDDDTIRFFKSRFGILFSNRYFISSEKSPYDVRKWTIRKVDWRTGKISDVGGFQQFASERSAKAYLRKKKKLKDIF